MLSKIDWISFSVLTAHADSERDALTVALASLIALHEFLPDWLYMTEEWSVGNGRAPYRTSWRNEARGVTLYTHPALTHALVEVSGQGCDNLTVDGTLARVLGATAERVTRIDIASDILTETRPLEFCDAGYNGRFKARSHVVSESGETFYVGARSSNRYARVYRYNAPHERHMLLRVETVTKQEDAKILARLLLDNSLESVVAAQGETFGWVHIDWSVGDESAELRVYTPDRREGKTLYWLADTVAPLLARLHKAGTIDVDTWFNETVLARLKD